MLDMTLDKKEKKNFITGVKPSEDFKTFMITFADGNSIEKEFNVEDYLMELRGLEKQYLHYRKEYLGKINKLFVNVWSKRIIELLVAIGSVYLVANIDVAEWFQNVYAILAVLYTVYAQLVGKGVTDAIKELFQHINICDDIVKGSKEYTIPVAKPDTEETIEWPVLNLGNVDQYSNYDVEIFGRLTDESKVKLGMGLSKKIYG